MNWIKSSTCESGSCVEVLIVEDLVSVRNSHDTDPEVCFTINEWAEFIEAIRRGEFDVPQG